MALDLLMMKKVHKRQMRRYVKETMALADAHDDMTNLQTSQVNLEAVQANAKQQTQDIFDLVKQLKDINRS